MPACPPARAVPAEGPRAAAVPQRGDRARRQDRRHHHVGQLRPSSRRRDRPGLCAVPGRERGGRAGSSYEIEIAGERFAAEASLKPMYDPKAERVQDVAARASENAATFRLTFARNAARRFRRRGVHQVVRQDSVLQRLAQSARMPRRIVLRPGWPISHDHQRGAPQVVTTPIFLICVISGMIRPPSPAARRRRRSPRRGRASPSAWPAGRTTRSGRRTGSPPPISGCSICGASAGSAGARSL